MKYILYWSTYIPLIGIIIFILYGIGKFEEDEVCLEDPTHTLLSGFIQFFAIIVATIELELLQ